MNKRTTTSFWPTAVRRIFPLIFLLMLFIGSVLFNRETAETTAVSATPATGMEDAPAPTASGIATSAAPATVTAVASPTPPPTPTPYPLPAPDTLPLLLGPPQNSTFFADTPLIFYWSWPEDLLVDQEFFLLLTNGTEEQRFGPIQEQNLGGIYQYAQSGLTQGAYSWTIILVSQTLASEIVRSETRTINVMTR